MAGRLPETKKSLVKHFKKNPIEFMERIFGVSLWGKQREIFEAVWNNRYTAVKSCFGSGKSYVAACLVVAFVHLYPDSVVITTAPSYRQLNNIWSVVHKLFESTDKELGSELFKHEIRCGAGWYAVGFTTNVPERLQGIHAPNVLILEDESAGIEAEIHERLDALMVPKNAHMLSIGNPLSAEGHFYHMFKDPNYTKMTISAFDTPNVMYDEERIPGLVTREWVENQRHKYGEESPYWKSKVLGEFPEVGEDSLIPLSWIEKSAELWHQAEAPDAQPVYGFDPAGGGLNESVLIKRVGNYVYPPRFWQGLDSVPLVTKIEDTAPKNNIIYTDSVGIGHGIIGLLRERNFSVASVNVAERATEENKFYNQRAEYYWRLRKALDPDTNENVLLLPDDEDLKSQLASLKYEIDTRGRVKIESKKKMRNRGVKSPDRADALMLTMGNYGLENVRPIEIGSMNRNPDLFGDEYTWSEIPF